MDNREQEQFLSRLVEETYSKLEEGSGQDKIKELSHNFILKENSIGKIIKHAQTMKFVVDQSEKSARLHYLPNIGTYRMVLGDHILDFPKNWSIFKEIEGESNNIILRGTNDDRDCLIEVLSEIIGEFNTIALSFSNGEVMAYFLKENHNTILKHLTGLKMDDSLKMSS